MNEVSTQDPITAVETLLDQALPEAPLLSEEQILSEHQSLRRAWGSQQIFAGTPAEIKAIILPNLQELAAIPQFEQFVVRVLPNLSCAQVIAVLQFVLECEDIRAVRQCVELRTVPGRADQHIGQHGSSRAVRRLDERLSARA